MKKTTKLKTIYIGADHTGFDAKNKIIAYLKDKNYIVKDMGGTSPTAPDDYPDFGYAVSSNVAKDKNNLGIAICGTGVGICIASNKIKGIRAALVYDPKVADLAVRHDNANVLCLAARITNIKKMFEIIDIFLSSKFEKGRHLRRVNKITKIENNKYEKK
ncbi:ribose 5-phosphate isomerase B [Mycoplasmoides pirum]|uniref:ribose 5-phosphate isomerase B n=1 Tax=Mycoplasmoides pirum TaxID=2122 RepID=UPI00056585B3|nr:ribose 5-phosphate isomerase B [Mycoplasmoides pirum]